MNKIIRKFISNKNILWPFFKKWLFQNFVISKNSIFRCSSVQISGKGNVVSIESGAKISNCFFYIKGNNNTIIIDKNCVLNDVTFTMGNDNNIVCIGEGSTFTGKTNLICLDNTKIIIGIDCMFAFNINLRTGDHHPIFGNNGERINASRDIIIGNHCWIGQGATILKGSEIGTNSIVGCNSLVTKKINDENVIIVGTPGRIVKKEIKWER